MTPRYQVLVVDDSPVYRKLIEHVLSDEPCYDPLYAHDGGEALRLYREHSPSIVITDWMMPDISGIELCRQIRADSSRPYTYIILMTANTGSASVVKGLEAGADDYLTKPFDDSEMLARVGVGRRIIDLNRELAAQRRKLEEAARTDSLTGLPNRRALEEWAEKLMEGARRHGFHFWVVLGDIDSFKTINDTFGHEAGDTVLRAFADLLREGTRSSDISGRLGGDEFLLVITHVSPDGINLMVNRIREKFAALSFPFAGKSVKVTTSFGAVGFQSKDVHDFRFLVRKADQMLYEAKGTGRNCVRVLCLKEGELH
jgi:two-component system, cell cycle response regulator